MTNDKDQQVEMTRLVFNEKLPSAVKGKILAASKAAKPPVKFNKWIMNVLIAASETATSDDGFVVVMKDDVPHLSGGGFLIPVGCSHDEALEFVDYLNVAISQAVSRRLA